MTDVIRLDMTNVTKSCVACNGTVVTTHNKIPVCASCRAQGLAGVDELSECGQLLTYAREAAAACHKELTELGRFECPTCRVHIKTEKEIHMEDCVLAVTLGLPMSDDPEGEK